MSSNTYEKDIMDFLIDLEHSVDSVLSYEVANEIKDIMIGENPVDGLHETMGVVGAIVYDAYKPKMYERRYTQGGLVDRENIKSTVISNENSLIVKNIAEGSEVVETGEGYEFPYEGMGARPFHQKVEEIIREDSSRIDIAISKGLKSFGFDAYLKK